MHYRKCTSVCHVCLCSTLALCHVEAVTLASKLSFPLQSIYQRSRAFRQLQIAMRCIQTSLNVIPNRAKGYWWRPSTSVANRRRYQHPTEGRGVLLYSQMLVQTTLKSTSASNKRPRTRSNAADAPTTNGAIPSIYICELQHALQAWANRCMALSRRGLERS